MTPLQLQLIQDEELRLKPYTDTVGKLTIGIGRNLTDVGISNAEAMQMLNNDIQSVQFQLSQKLFFWSKLNQARQDALTNMAFNMGVPKFMEFHATILLLAKGDYKSASTECLNSHWAVQVGERAKRIANKILIGS
jgi:lysozyme